MQNRLISCNGNWDSFYNEKSGALEMHHCIHFKPVAKAQKVDNLKPITLAVVYAIVTAATLYTVL